MPEDGTSEVALTPDGEVKLLINRFDADAMRKQVGDERYEREISPWVTVVEPYA